MVDFLMEERFNVIIGTDKQITKGTQARCFCKNKDFKNLLNKYKLKILIT
jgi:hypothetical protein